MLLQLQIIFGMDNVEAEVWRDWPDSITGWNVTLFAIEDDVLLIPDFYVMMAPDEGADCIDWVVSERVEF